MPRCISRTSPEASSTRRYFARRSTAGVALSRCGHSGAARALFAEALQTPVDTEAVLNASSALSDRATSAPKETSHRSHGRSLVTGVRAFSGPMSVMPGDTVRLHVANVANTDRFAASLDNQLDLVLFDAGRNSE